MKRQFVFFHPVYYKLRNLKHRNIYVFVTNDLNQDQRMDKVCRSLMDFGYHVVLIGRQKQKSPPIISRPFAQKRFPIFFHKGPLFYFEYTIRMVLYLFRQEKGIIYAVDLDTLVGATFFSYWTKQPILFDAHEWYTETPELTDRYLVKRIWEWVARWGIPKVNIALTVNSTLADIFTNVYRKTFTTIYNVPKVAGNLFETNKPLTAFCLVYQGVLNKGRGLETIIKAMEKIPNARLLIVGEGDLSEELKNLAQKSKAAERIVFPGWLFGEELKNLTRTAHLGLNLLDASSKSYYYSLANKFFDYMHAGVPSINMAFPEYRDIIRQIPVGWILEKLDSDALSQLVCQIMDNPEEYLKRKSACREAMKKYHWEMEENKLEQVLREAKLL